MGNDHYKKVDRISVKEILKYEHQLYVEDNAKIQAIREMEHIIRELGSKDAYKFSGFIRMLRSLKTPTISDNLAAYIKSKSYLGLRRNVGHTIVKNPGGEYTSFELHEHWKRIKIGIFSKFFYYDDAEYVNVYTLDISELPKYINFNFDDDDKEIYKKRLRGD